MIRSLLSFLLFFCICNQSFSQFTDNFNDGNFTANPAWTGNTSDWSVNSSFQLQSNNTTTNSNFYLSTPNTLATTAQWDFYTQLTFNTSGANYTDVFLTASAVDISLATTTGYFVRLGNTDDEISLYRKDATGVSVKIIDGINATLNTSNNVMKIRVVRNAANLWILSRDLTGTGNAYITEGTVTDATYTTSAYFGILVRQSTASFFQRHYFDDISVQTYVPDVVPPAIVSATVIDANTLDILFNEGVDPVSSQSVANYNVSGGIGFPLSAVLSLTNPSLLRLTFANAFPNRTTLTLTVNGVNDMAGNTLNNGTVTFAYFTPDPYDVVIDEIMADPTPQVALPNSEWIELKNTSGFDINLAGWRVGKTSGESGPMPSFNLRPDSFVIVTTSSAVAELSRFGNVISVTSFPTLSNDGDLIYLKSPTGTFIHVVEYSSAWYKNELKKEGGWTLEMIDTRNPCAGFSNWTASTDISGGTPGRKNSADAVNPDADAPKLIRAYAPDSVTVILVFNEPVSATSAAGANYTFSNGIANPTTVAAVSPTFTRVTLTLSTPLLRNIMYTVTANGISDCSGNILNNGVARVGLFENLDSLDLVINEILFNPVPSSVDYVELYNRSNKIINLRNAYLANYSSTNVISSITQISTEDYLLFPGDFVVITTDVQAVLSQFVAQDPSAFIQLPSMPSYSDASGTVIVLNQQGNIVDLVTYDERWHFSLISNREGVALERIDYNGMSNNSSNWHSAASSVNFGTPTYKNSQSRLNETVSGTIKISPEVFSPDNDGFDDFLTIDYQFPDPGYVANITIFDAVGRPVRYLQRNALNGIRGTYRWDGLGEKNQKLATGLYIIYTEVFNLEGKTKKYKNVVTLARKR